MASPDTDEEHPGVDGVVQIDLTGCVERSLNLGMITAKELTPPPAKSAHPSGPQILEPSKQSCSGGACW